MINKKTKIYIAGHKGMVGSSLIRLFEKKGFKNILTRTKKQLNLLDQSKTYAFLKKHNPEVVIIAAAKVGGIHANNEYRAEFIYQNLQIQNNLIHGSFLAGIKKLIFLGSSCIYPRDCKQPIKEEYLLTSPLEQTNEPYAIAKIAGLKMIENYNRQYNTKYLCLMPCNLYGPNDNYNLTTSHFLPALISKCMLAKKNNLNFVEIWGNGRAKREVMFVDDLADATLFFLNKKTSHFLINIGTGIEFMIKEYFEIISKKIGLNARIKFNRSMPNGTPRKLLDNSISKKYGWSHKINLSEGLDKIINDFKK